MNYKTWFNRYEDELFDAYIESDSRGSFSTFCNEQFSIYEESGEI